MKDYLNEFEPPEHEEKEWLYIIGSGLLFGWMVAYLLIKLYFFFNSQIK